MSDSPVPNTETDVDVAVREIAHIEVDAPFVGQWNQVVSTTNWEKGRILCEWRAAMKAQGVDSSAYTDEAWSQLVGGVTSQHVGRLRRVFERFGGVVDQYEGLFWSHFQAAIDWDDAEMWLEGAIRNQWSVSRMRGKRWETVGNSGEPPAEPEEMDDGATAIDRAEAVEDPGGVAAGSSGPRETAVKEAAEVTDEEAADDAEEDDGASSGEQVEDGVGGPSIARRRLSVDVEDLPEDLADAFEQFKLAILVHRREGWSDTTPEEVIECLDALKQLTLAPLD